MNRSSYSFSDRRLHFAAVLAILFVAAALRLRLFAGYAGFDDAEYARIAYRIAVGTFVAGDYGGPVVFPLRVGLTVPTALGFGVFGFGEWSMVLYPFILSLLSLGLAYVCAGHFFGQRAGLIAAALMSVIPLEVGSATKLLPDMPAAFYAAMGVTIVAVGSRAGAEKGAQRIFWYGVLAGAAFGLSWLCKESVTFLAPFCLTYFAICFRQDRRMALLLWAGVAAGSLGILFGEMIAYYQATGNFLYRFHAIERNYRLIENGFFTQGSDFGWREGESYARALAKRLLIEGPALLLLQYEFLFVPLVGLIAAFHGWYSKDRAFLVPSLWLVTLLLMFNFSSTSLTSYMPLPLFHRYFYMIIFPAVVLTAGLVAKLAFQGADSIPEEARRERLFWGLLVGIALLLSGGYYVQGALRYPASAWTAEVRTLSAKIAPSSPLYADTLSLRGLEFYLGYPGATAWKDLSSVGSTGEMRPGSLVLVNAAYVEWLNRNAGMWLSPRSGYRDHGLYDSAPPSWTRLWQGGNARLYRVE